MISYELIILGLIFLALAVLAILQRYGKKPKKEKEDMCVLYNGKTYILTAGCNEKQCIEFLGEPTEAQRVKETTILCYYDKESGKIIKFYFKANKVQNFEYEEVKRDYGGW